MWEPENIFRELVLVFYLVGAASLVVSAMFPTIGWPAHEILGELLPPSLPPISVWYTGITDPCVTMELLVRVLGIEQA